MTHQLEILFTYNDESPESRPLRREINWAERLDDLFAGLREIDSTPTSKSGRQSVANISPPIDDKASFFKD